MAHKIAKREFDHVAYDRDYKGKLKWTYTPRSIATAKAKARREGYDIFFTAKGDGYPNHNSDITMYVWGDNRWIKG